MKPLKKVLYSLFTNSSGLESKSGINLEKTATAALWNGPPTPPRIIIASDGIAARKISIRDKRCTIIICNNHIPDESHKLACNCYKRY